METVGWILVAFAAARLTVAAVNFFSRPYPGGKTGPASAPSVSVLIPARNEETNIADLLGDLSAVTYPNLEIIVYDDDSSDGTAGEVRRAAVRDPRVKLVKGCGLPEGWLGKNHACHRLAMQAKGQLLLFLDADVRVRDGFIEKAVGTVGKYGLGLLSVFPRQLMPTCGTRTVVPLMNSILLGLLPLVAVRLSPLPSLAAANGQFMLFDATAYRRVLPHEKCRSEAVEDIAIIKEYKRLGLPVATLLGKEDISCRMYRSGREAIAGFSKNVFEFFGGSVPLAFAYALATTVAPVYLFAVSGVRAGLAYCLIVLTCDAFVSAAGRQPVIRNLLLLAPRQAALITVMVNALRSARRKRLLWKGRNIAAPPQSPQHSARQSNGKKSAFRDSSERASG